jgi:hypothetical protein
MRILCIIQTKVKKTKEKVGVVFVLSVVAYGTLFFAPTTRTGLQQTNKNSKETISYKYHCNVFLTFLC